MGSTLRRATLHVITALLVVQLTWAFPCERTTDQASCSAVLAAGLPVQETQDILASMIADARTWNNAITEQGVPAGKRVTNKGLVRNAWTKVIAVTPSVVENGAFLIPTDGEIVALRSFEVTTPSGTERGDCRTTYSLQTRNTFNVLANDATIGNGRVSAFHASANVVFMAQLIIKTTLTVRHYRWREDEDGRRCVFSGTETRKDTVTVTDTLAATLHNPVMQADITTLSVQNGGVEILPAVTNTAGYVLAVGNATYGIASGELVPMLSDAPYYPLTYRVQTVNKVTASNVRYGPTGIIVVPGPCQFTLYDYFRIQQQSCILSRDVPRLSVSTDKQSYTIGDTIRATASESAIISYAGTNASGPTATFTAVSGASFIEARTATQEAWTAVTVDSGAWDDVLNALLAAPVALVLWRASRFLIGGVL